MHRVTLQTIADRVGVSRTTVSNAFSRPDQLKEELRQRILAVAEDLSYPGPNPAARTLRRGRAGVIGVVFTETLSYAFADSYAVGFLRGLARVAEQSGTGLHLNNMMGEEDLAAGREMPPGTRLTSMQAPTMVVGPDGVELVVGSSGSNRLRSAITQVAINVIDHGMGAREAIDHPRVHVEGDRLDCEGGFDPVEIEKLERWGERVNRFAGLNLYFGGANAVVARGGALEAAGERAMAEAFGLIERAEQHPSGRLFGMVVPAQIDTCSETLLRESSQEAKARGLVNRAVPPDQLDAEVETLVASIVAKPRQALAMGKELFYRQRELGIEAAYQLAGQTMAVNMMDGCAQEGVAAFAGKRKPKWAA